MPHYIKLVTRNNKQIEIRILDTAPGEEYSITRDVQLRIGEAFIAMYSITCESSFNELKHVVQRIQREKQHESPGLFPMVVIGNKCDLESDRQVKTEDGTRFAEEHKAPFFETSAKFGLNVAEAIETLLEITLQNKYLPEKNRCVII